MGDSKFDYVKFYHENTYVVHKLDELTEITVKSNIHDFIEYFEEYVKDFSWKINRSDEAFTKDVKLIGILDKLKEAKEEIDIHKLWVLTVFIYRYILLVDFALLKPTIQDELGLLKEFSNINTISFSNSNHAVTVTNKELIRIVQNTLVEVDEESFPKNSYEIHSVKSIEEISDKRVIDYCFAYAFKFFLTGYFPDAIRRKNAEVSIGEQELILRVMHLVGFYRDTPKTHTYRRLMSDFKGFTLQRTINIISDDKGYERAIELTMVKWKDWRKYNL